MTLHGGLHAEPYENTPSPHNDAVIGSDHSLLERLPAGSAVAVPEISRAGTVPGQSEVIAVPR